jgi:hypothetical protein
MTHLLHTFILDDRGAVTVDWTVLSSATVAMSLATVALLNGTLRDVEGRLDAELRAQQMSDNFIQFTSEHFEPLYAANVATEEEVEAVYDVANQLMNQEIIDALEYGIEKLEAGALTEEQAIDLMAVASVARQRNIVDSNVLDYYFGFDGGDGRINDYF